MNEIQLSDSLPVIETEIKQYQNLAGESIFEIGRRLKHVKENDLVHGEFINWIESQLNMDRTTANKFMKVADELPNADTYRHLGSNALYMITTLPEPERTREHITSKGETKTPDEMTVKELRELKKQLQSTQRENEILQNQLEDAENQEPEVIEKYTEPEDYRDTKNMNEHLTKEREYYKKIADDFREEIKSMNKAQPEKQISSVEPIDQTKVVLEMLNHIDSMIDSETVSINGLSVKGILKKIIEKVDE